MGSMRVTDLLSFPQCTSNSDVRCDVQLSDVVSLDTKSPSLSSSQVCASTSFFTQTLQRLESLRKMDRPMAVRMMKIAIRSVQQ